MAAQQLVSSDRVKHSHCKRKSQLGTEHMLEKKAEEWAQTTVNAMPQDAFPEHGGCFLQLAAQTTVFPSRGVPGGTAVWKSIAL